MQRGARILRSAAQRSTPCTMQRAHPAQCSAAHTLQSPVRSSLDAGGPPTARPCSSPPPQLPFVCITRPPGMASPPPLTVVPAATANGTDVLVAGGAVPRLLAASATRRATAALRTAALILGARPGLTVLGRSRRLAADDLADGGAVALNSETPTAAGRRLAGQLTAPPGVVVGGNATSAMGGAGGRFQLLTGNFTWQAAETACRAVGGHLATYDDYRQQLLVESSYTGLVRRLWRCWRSAAALAWVPRPAHAAARRPPNHTASNLTAKPPKQTPTGLPVPRLPQDLLDRPLHQHHRRRRALGLDLPRAGRQQRPADPQQLQPLGLSSAGVPQPAARAQQPVPARAVLRRQRQRGLLAGRRVGLGRRRLQRAHAGDVPADAAGPVQVRSRRAWHSHALQGSQVSVQLAAPRPASEPTTCRLRRYNASSGAAYMLDTQLRSFEGAQAACNAAGGHLVSYASVSGAWPPPPPAHPTPPHCLPRRARPLQLPHPPARNRCPTPPHHTPPCPTQPRPPPSPRTQTTPLLQDAEQLEVEGFMAARGYLLPGFHTFYWIGLRLLDLPWPNFVWTDPALPAPSVRGGAGGPSHWGTVRGGCCCCCVLRAGPNP